MEFASHHEKNVLTQYTVLTAKTTFQRVEYWHDRTEVEFYIVANDGKRWLVDSWTVQVGSTPAKEIPEHFAYVQKMEDEGVDWWRYDDVLDPAVIRA